MARILAVTSRLPFPPREGHQHRAWHLLRALAARHEVTLLSLLRADDDREAVAAMQGPFAGIELFPLQDGSLRTAAALLRSTLTRTPFVALRYRSARLRARIAALAPRADLVHFDMLPLMRHADCVPAGIPLVYNAHNVEHQLLAARVRVTRGHGLRGVAERAFLGTQVERLRRFERSACLRAQRVLACSAADADALHALDPRIRAEVVPNGVDLDQLRPAASDAATSGLVFVGQMGWFPNRDGIAWFLRDVFPRILAERPGTRFVLVGKADGLDVPSAVAGHVTVTGFVPDLQPLVHAAAVYVVPLRAGSGTRLKVLEAMALGKAIVTTRVGSEGIQLEPDIAALYADDAARFAAAVVTLLDDPALRARLGHEARSAAERVYGWDAIGTHLVGLYDELLMEPLGSDGELQCRALQETGLQVRAV